MKVLTLSLFLTLSVFAMSVVGSGTVSAQYDCGAYGYSTYGNQQNCDGSDLSNTGEALYVIVPAILVVTGSVGLYKLSRKSKSKKTTRNSPN